MNGWCWFLIIFMMFMAFGCTKPPKKTFTQNYQDCMAVYHKPDAETQCTAYAFNVCTSPFGGCQ